MLHTEFCESMISCIPLQNSFGDTIIKPGELFYLIYAQKEGRDGTGFINLLIEPDKSDSLYDIQIPFLGIERLKTRKQLRQYLTLIMQPSKFITPNGAHFNIGPFLFTVDKTK